MCEGEKTRRKKEKKTKEEERDKDDSRKWNVWMKKKKKDGRKLYILKKKKRNLMSQYFYNFSQKILNSRLLSTITTGKKIKKKQTNLCGMFKLKPVTTYYLRFVLKILWS